MFQVSDDVPSSHRHFHPPSGNVNKTFFFFLNTFVHTKTILNAQTSKHERPVGANKVDIPHQEFRSVTYKLAFTV